MEGWVCEGCGYVAGGEASESCPECGSDRFAIVKEGVETVGPREISSVVMGERGADTDTTESATSTIKRLASDPTVRWLAILAVFGGVVGLSIATGFIDVDALLGQEASGTIGIGTDCTRPSATQVDCVHDLEVRHSHLSSGVLVVQYTVDGTVLEEHSVELTDLEAGMTHQVATTFESDADSVDDFDLSFDLVEMDWAD
ncbi:MAG: hypothetical protein ACLFM8_08955 [Halobacteriales archaeon]